MATLLGAQLNTLDLETLTTLAWPPSHASGGLATYSSATAIAMAAGKFRDSTNTYNLSPSAATLSITTIAAISGLDETTLTATATTSGASASVTMTASLWVETPMTNTVRTGTGTITGAGTTITGTSTLFLSEVAIGDLIRSTSTGATRVTAIASNTSLTVAAAFPGGSPAGSGFTIYESAIILPNTLVAADRFRINTVTHDGLTIVMASAITSGAGSGKTAKLGGEIVSCPYYIWAVYGGSGHGYILSSQRTRPYNVTGYTTAWRRCGSWPNNPTGDLAKGFWLGTGSLRFFNWNYPASDTRVLSGGTATTWTDVDFSIAVPPTAPSAFLRLINVYSSTARGLSVRANGSADLGSLVTDGVTSNTVNAFGPIPVIGGAVEYQFDGAGSTGYIDINGYWETY